MQQTVENIIKQKPFLQEVLAKGLVNYAAVANDILNQVEKELGKQVKHEPVMEALEKLGKTLEKEFVGNICFNNTCRITTTKNLVSITVKKNKESTKATAKISSIVDAATEFFTLAHGIDETTIITEEKHKELLLDRFDPKDVIKVIENLSALTVKIPLDFLDTPGLFYLVTRELTWEDISTTELISTLTELTFILKTDDLKLAEKCVNELIHRK